MTWTGTLQGQASDFHTYVFGGEWANLDRVVFFDSVPWASGVGFSIDNITVAIPEPGMLALDLGVAALTVTLWRGRTRRGTGARARAALTSTNP